MPLQQGSAQNPAAGAVPQLAGVDLMAILQSVGIQPMQQAGLTDVKQEQQAGMQVRSLMPPQAVPCWLCMELCRTCTGRS